MPTTQKAKVIEQTTERYQRSVGVLFTEYRGLKVKELQKLRADLGNKGGEMQVVKNTLFLRAAGDDAANIPTELSSGPTAVAFLYENETECAKILVDYAKTNKNLVVKGGFIGGKALSDKQIESFSKLPPRDMLIAQLIGTIVAPLTQLVGVVEALYADPIRVIGAVADKVAEESGTPIPAKAEAAPAAEVAAEAPAEAAAETTEESAAPAESAPEAESAPAESPADETSAPADDAAAPTEDTPTETQE